MKNYELYQAQLKDICEQAIGSITHILSHKNYQSVSLTHQITFDDGGHDQDGNMSTYIDMVTADGEMSTRFQGDSQGYMPLPENDVFLLLAILKEIEEGRFSVEEHKELTEK